VGLGGIAGPFCSCVRAKRCQRPEYATSTLKTYVDPVTNITLVIGGIVGIVGAIRVYSKWNSGDQDINKELMGWGGSCVFLVVSALVIKSFFGLT
jgi:hypothetical protein